MGLVGVLLAILGLREAYGIPRCNRLYAPSGPRFFQRLRGGEGRTQRVPEGGIQKERLSRAHEGLKEDFRKRGILVEEDGVTGGTLRLHEDLQALDEGGIYAQGDSLNHRELYESLSLISGRPANVIKDELLKARKDTSKHVYRGSQGLPAPSVTKSSLPTSTTSVQRRNIQMGSESHLKAARRMIRSGKKGPRIESINKGFYIYDFVLGDLDRSRKKGYGVEEWLSLPLEDDMPLPALEPDEPERLKASPLPHEAWPDQFRQSASRMDPGPGWIPDDIPGHYNRDPNAPMDEAKTPRQIESLQTYPITIGGKQAFAGPYRVYGRELTDPYMATKDTPRDQYDRPVAFGFDPTRLMPRSFPTAEDDRTFETIKKEKQSMLLLAAYEKIRRNRLLDFGIYRVLLYAFSHIGSWRMSLRIFQEMNQVSYRHDTATLSGLIKGFQKSERWEQALYMFELWRQKGVEIDNGLLFLLLRACNDGRAPLEAYKHLFSLLDDPADRYERRKKAERKAKAAADKDKESDPIVDAINAIDERQEKLAKKFKRPSDKKVRNSTWFVEDVVFGRQIIDNVYEYYRQDFPEYERDLSVNNMALVGQKRMTYMVYDPYIQEVVEDRQRHIEGEEKTKRGEKTRTKKLSEITKDEYLEHMKRYYNAESTENTISGATTESETGDKKEEDWSTDDLYETEMLPNEAQESESGEFPLFQDLGQDSDEEVLPF
ncbi:hypothetical protein AAMO2058_000528300 [Amorphochlora amoebiformis]